MTFVNIIEILKGKIGDTLRDRDFLARTDGLSLDHFRDAAQQELKKRGIDVTVIALQKAPVGAPNDLIFQWQSAAGGEYEHQWFSRDNPTAP
jgi:hypothetical protein